MSRSERPLGTPPIERLRTLVALLENPMLARVYVHLFRSDGVTVNDLVTELDVPQGTA